jgi:hypothetical protein
MYGTARALGVSYGALKQHVDRHGDAGCERRKVRFVELPAAPVADRYVIEIDSPAGATMRVRLNGLPLSHVAEFVRLVVGGTS